MRLLIIVLISAALCAAQQEPEHRIRVSWDVAKSKALTHPEIQCPPIAKTVNVRGEVAIEIAVDRDGKVRSTKVKSGHPMLTQAALDNVRQWTFEPMMVNGEKVVMETTAEIEPCGSRGAAYDKESKFRDEQIATNRECRARLQANDPANAETTCKKALEMAHRVRGNTYLYESNALNNLGILRLQQQKASEALELFQEALKLLEANQKPDEAEIGYVVSWIGIGKRQLGDDAGALPYLERAQRIFSARIAGTEFDEMRKNYAGQLKRVRQQQAGALEQLGRTDEAEAIRKLATE
jgi:TonB family protein